MIALAIVIFLIVCCDLAALWFGTHRRPRHPHVRVHTETYLDRRRLP